MDNNPLKSFLKIPYDVLEEMNLTANIKRDTVSHAELEKEYKEYLRKEKLIKAVTICFSDIEGRFHMLDYDKKYFLESAENLTFDGSSIRGFSELKESDLRLSVDWSSIHWLPADIFGSGKVILFANIKNRDKTQYESDFRGILQEYTKKLEKEQQIIAYAAPEIEGFLLDGVDAEQNFNEKIGFKLISMGGYYHSLPLDRLRLFIDAAAEAQRAMGFMNEKDHPEVAPSQFEMNFAYKNVLRTCDQTQLYKLVCRQVANSMGMTASFIPKPVSGINGSGMHINISLAKAGQNIFYDKKGQDGLSEDAWDFLRRILNHAPEICVILNSSVNAYRRLDPHFEAPNQIKVSPIDRGAMIRIPAANEKTSRIEIRSVAPDANPYLCHYAILRVGLEGKQLPSDKSKRQRVRSLPSDINEAIKLCKSSKFMDKIIGEKNKRKYLYYKELAADRSPRELGRKVKTSEIIFHHEITDQVLWNSF
ncbi:MAG: glutamine synthetase [Candidatus Levybacteria bacterium RIFCSPHIGHO2_02_FULL_39_36]|nr:MAG: Glutamine synthetase [Candidatus Levybacteria bacterium GW2011_GWA1_39_11]KKR25619.1 MAG: Glutamine synthetase [Microgenomates group bacterium GW2011_GWC1_39_7]OGH27496.1 MAG: glutamine synthetase [Candidatus Levybacteria bacterium RIFCSPHIGHO2_02_FULL_39_36]OGH47199.1 MAG: glutamine synthetase [Candidatus Levybacteria bacterium RIFCSPLOWO2_12_FULL_39_17]